MSKKTKDFTPFPGVVCQRIRNLVNEREKAQAKRKDLFNTRDMLKREIFKLDNSAKERGSKESEAFRVIAEIDDLHILIKWYNDELATTVQKADEPGLFEDASVTPPKDLFVPKGADEESDDDGDVEGQAELPVGGRDNPFDDLSPALKFPGAFRVTKAGGGKSGEVFCTNLENLEYRIAEMCGDDAKFNATTRVVMSGSDQIATVEQVSDDRWVKDGKPPASEKPESKPARKSKGKRAKAKA